MTILQKMLAVPVLSLLLYSVFIIYSYSENQQNSEKIAEIRNDYLPLLELANENIRLFGEMRGIFKDAVLAGESGWLTNIQALKQTIEANLKQLEAFPHIVEKNQLDALKISFELYQSNAWTLASNIIGNEGWMTDSEELIQNIEIYHNDSLSQFAALKNSIHSRFRQSVDDINQVMQRLLFVGSLISIALMVFLLAVTLFVSLSTSRSVYKVIERMKALALGGSDFGQRLERQQKDELGYLIFWFNKLADKLEQSYIALEMVSITDKLTQLNNRNRTDTFFPQALAKAQASKSDLAVILLDIDHFKSINDNYGHLVGDNILRAFAKLLKENAGPHDFLGRWGGEEFIIVIQDADSQQVMQYAEELRQKIASYNFTDVGSVTSSFGVAMCTPSDDPNAMLKRADEGLYKAKQGGRNCVVLEQGMPNK